jgi:protein SCO1/2
MLGDAFKQMFASASDPDMELLRISFDADNDSRQALKLYGERYGATAARWRIAMPLEGRDLGGLLRTFAVVIPDGLGGFVHNSGIYRVDVRGHLVGIFDPEVSWQVVSAALDGPSP